MDRYLSFKANACPIISAISILLTGALTGALSVSMTGCHTSRPEELKTEAVTERTPSSPPQAYLKYVTFKNNRPEEDVIDISRWQGLGGGFDGGARSDYLKKFYSANTRSRSNTGLKHEACFEGSAQTLQNLFFNSNDPKNKIAFVIGGYARTRSSQDGLALGISFTEQLKGGPQQPFFFRLQNCRSGKAEIGESRDRRLGQNDFAESETRRLPAAVESSNAMPGKGFMIEDQVQLPAGSRLPAFSLRSDYDRAMLSSSDRPWAGMDIRTEEGAAQFALLVQKHFYEGMATQDSSNSDRNFIAQNNGKRYWCHMPWMQVGESGREAIHGLTKERDYKPSTTMSLYSENTTGTDWGIGYYNGKGCQAIGKVFGTAGNPRGAPDFDQARFEDGTMSVKILFTTAQLKNTQGAYTWNANVSGVGSTARKLQPVQHIQMDISVKDSSLKGARPDVGNWVMLTYYFDPSYNSPLQRDLPGLPSGILRMRPMGVQTGFGPPSQSTQRESIIFQGSQTNGFLGRLNGPADNPKSSCLSCHGTAGLGVAMSPGYIDYVNWGKPTKSKSLDFSQQFALAKRNWETEPK
ncbi:MAG: hypothetical protein H7222_15055 [Methylotenera sp.]|nr:hypothetical protein [Oligoflexia bacterium]